MKIKIKIIIIKSSANIFPLISDVLLFPVAHFVTFPLISDALLFLDTPIVDAFFLPLILYCFKTPLSACFYHWYFTVFQIPQSLMLLSLSPPTSPSLRDEQWKRQQNWWELTSYSSSVIMLQVTEITWNSPRNHWYPQSVVYLHTYTHALCKKCALIMKEEALKSLIL